MNTKQKQKEEEARLLVELGARDPVWWVENVLGDRPWSAQRQILEAVRDHKNVAVRSCHGVGKDWIAARLVLWFLFNHRPSIVITTGPTDRQVRGILWKEIGAAFNGAVFPLHGQLLSQELKLERDWWAWGFTAPNTDPNRFQGFHEKNVFVVIDEACGVSGEIYTAVDAVLTSGNARKLEIGNPTNSITPFGGSFKRSGVHKISISAFDTPNFTKFGITLKDIANGDWKQKIDGRPLPNDCLITPEWVADKYEHWGPESPLFVSRILGDFPADSPDSLIPLSWIEAAQNRDLEPSEPSCLGVDVAREGDDKTVIMHRRGPHVRTIDKYNKVDTMETAGRVKRLMIELDPTDGAKVDEIGVGAGVYDSLKAQKMNVHGAKAGRRARDPERFDNARAEWFWGLRERFERGEIDIDPKDEDLMAQLAAIKWRVSSSGKIVIEGKPELKKRLHRSPDDADALAIAFADLSDYVAWHCSAPI